VGSASYKTSYEGPTLCMPNQVTDPIHATIAARALELQQGQEPRYEPIDLQYLATMEVANSKDALRSLISLESKAWATAEACLVQDLTRLLAGDSAFIVECAQERVGKDPSRLTSRAQVLSFIARIVSGSFEAASESASEAEPPVNISRIN